jgi:hypothetical protein
LSFLCQSSSSAICVSDRRLDSRRARRHPPLQTIGGATNSYGLGQVTGAILFILGGIWLIRSGNPRVRT